MGCLAPYLLSPPIFGWRASKWSPGMIAPRLESEQTFPPSAIPWWVTVIVVLGALLMAMGAVIALVHPAMLVSPGDEINGAVRIYAGYLFSRNLAVAVLLLLALGLRARGMLNTLVLLTAWIQIFDAGVDAWEGRWVIVPGVLVLGGMFLAASARLSGAPFWRGEAWRRDK